MKKIIAITLIFSVISLALIVAPIQKAYAIPAGIVADALWVINGIGSAAQSAATYLGISEDVQKQLGDIAEMLFLIALTVVMNEITNDMISWIDSGFDGKPGFVQNPESLITSAIDQASGSFLTQLAGSAICEPFKLNIQIPLQEVRRFGTEVKCTLSDIVKNINSFYDNFQNGGWLGWIELTSPQNNAYGAFLMAQNELLNKEVKAQKDISGDVDRNKGFLSVAECTGLYEIIDNNTGETLRTEPITGKTKEAVWEKAEQTFGEDLNEDTFLTDPVKCVTKTPSQVVSESLNKTIGGGSDLIQKTISNLSAKMGLKGKFMEPFIMAMLDALIRKGVMEGLSAAASYYADPESAVYTSIPDEIELTTTQINDDHAAAQIIKTSLPSLSTQLQTYIPAVTSAKNIATTIRQNQISILETEAKIAAIKDALTQSGYTNLAASCVFPTSRSVTSVIQSSNLSNPTSTPVEKFDRIQQIEINDSAYGTANKVETRTDGAESEPPEGGSPTISYLDVVSATPIGSGYSVPIQSTLDDLSDELTVASNTDDQIPTAKISNQAFIDAAETYLDLAESTEILPPGTPLPTIDTTDVDSAKTAAINDFQPLIAPKISNDYAKISQIISDLAIDAPQKKNDTDALIGGSATGDTPSADPNTLDGMSSKSSADLSEIQSLYSACKK